ncbi:MAG TPA: hypothetical protein VML75_20660, partial [Kofleriaceae bacterium]|nr:hypothetical protein [Kofleriaceae bacterium]
KPEHIGLSPSFETFLWWASPAQRAELETIHRLETRPVKVIWRQRDTVLVRNGLTPGERIVTSPVPAPIEGMRLRLGAGDHEDAEPASAPAPRAHAAERRP